MLNLRLCCVLPLFRVCVCARARIFHLFLTANEMRTGCCQSNLVTEVAFGLLQQSCS